MTEPTNAQLGALATPSAVRAAVVIWAGAHAVVLDTVEPDSVELWRDGQVETHLATALVTEESDPSRRQRVIRQALLNLARQREQALQETAAVRTRNAGMLQRIRAYAIHKHLAGAITRPQLDQFLAHFGLEPFGTDIWFQFEVFGSYEVSTMDRAETLRTGRRLILINLDAVRGVQSGTVQQYIDGAKASTEDVSDPSSRLKVTFVVSGHGFLSGTDQNVAKQDLQSGLELDLSQIPNLVAGSATHHARIAVQSADPFEGNDD